MNAGTFAEWFRRQGHEVIRSKSSYWYNPSPHVLQAFPYHWLIKPDESEIKELMRAHNVIALRYSAPASAACGKVSYHAVCEDARYELTSLSRQTRQNVRRGLELTRVEPIPISRLDSEGWQLRRDTLERQGRTGAESEESWHRLCQSAQGLPGFEAWGAICQGRLAASFLAFQCDDWYTLPYQQSLTSQLDSRANNALFYHVIKEGIRRTGIRGVFFCLESLDAHASVDEFKFRMGVTAKAVRQRVVFHSLLEPLLGQACHGVIRRLHRRFPAKSALAKAEGMLRFYLEGKLPAAEQHWPVCLPGSHEEAPRPVHV